MTKIISVGDLHVSDSPPINCTETYTDDILDILRWIAEEGARRNVDAVVWAGDVFHHKAATKNSHRLVMKMLRCAKYFDEVGVELRIVVGNHDLSMDVYGSLHVSQPLGVLFEAGVKELNGWHPTLPLYGVPWQQDWDETLHDSFEDFRNRDATGEALAVTHASIFPPGKEPIFDHLLAEDVATAMGRSGSLHFGHIHDDYGVWETGGVTFANPGALSRGSLTESHLNRVVKVVIWEDGVFEELEVPHKPAEEVFRIAEGTAAKEEKLDAKEFLQSIGYSSIAMTDSSDIVNLIKQKDIGDGVKKLAIELIEEAS